MGEVTQSDISRLYHKVDNVERISLQLEREVSATNQNVSEVKNAVSQLKGDLRKLANDFNKMVKEQRRQATLSQALTEIVRVRQELEQKFGNYKVVRETMLGILQATDLALVKKTTISRVSEEIMISTPEYWLAPCLVAVAAWISNDRDLAERAVREAVRRDEEKTALTMALICRRNGRTSACYEWLAIYFSKQNAANFSEASFAYIDAYVNGIFGHDEKHICDDYIAKWIGEIKGNSKAFESEQEEMWKSYCQRFSGNVDNNFPNLKAYAEEYPRINEYLGRIDSVTPISNKFESITSAEIDGEALKKKIDENLISLISRYDAKEEPLRKEEAFLQKVKEFNGNSEKARAFISQEEIARKEQTLNLVEQMSRVIVSDEVKGISQKKTAVMFLKSYIRRGFNSYIKEKRDEFPQEITLRVGEWRGVTKDGQNKQELENSFHKMMIARKNAELNAVNRQGPKQRMTMAAIVGAFGLVAMLINIIFGLFVIAGAGYLWLSKGKAERDIIEKIESINRNYETLISDGKTKINHSCEEWKKAKTVVDNFHNSPTKDIVA